MSENNGFWKIDAWTNGCQIVIWGIPPDSDDLGISEDGPLNHNCDEMGCGSVGGHILLRIPVMHDTPELSWAKDGWQPVEPEGV